MGTEWLADDAYRVFKSKLNELSSSVGANEAATRLRVIDTILFEVLRWDKNDVDVEKYTRATGYLDYMFGRAPVFSLVLEAKRDEAEFVLPKESYPASAIPFSLIAKQCPAAADALRQARGYATQYGARYSAITNGHQWLMALTFVPNQMAEDSLIFVFESLQAISDKFPVFYECFSEKAINTNLPNLRLLDARRGPAPQKLSANGIVNYPTPADRNKLANTLRSVLQLVWDEANFDTDNVIFLQHCYITPEASEDMLRVARELLEQRSATDVVVSAEHADPKKIIKEAESSAEKERPIVLVGRIGHGKSTFLNYLRLIEARSVLEQRYIQIDIDFLDEPATAHEVPAFILDEVERQLKDTYNIEMYSDDVTRQALKSELKDFHGSPRGKMLSKEGREKELEEAEVAFMEEYTKDRQKYFKYLVRLIRRGYRKSLAIFFDNLDRRPDDIQEVALLRASAIASEWAALVFVCLRPSTVQKSQTRGVLDTIAPRLITVSPPKTAPMLRKRFQYAAKFARGGLPPEAYSRAPLSNDVEASLPTVADVFEVCDQSILKKPYLAQQYEAVANGNVRQIIKYVRDTLTSAHLDTEKLIRKLHEEGAYDLSEHDTLRALLYGPFLHYEPNSSLFMNLLDIAHADATEHFSRILLLDYCQRHAVGGGTYGFVPINKVYAYMASIGYTTSHIDETISSVFGRRCIEGRDHDEETPELGDQIRITSLGSYHLTALVRKFIYLDAVVVDTPILDEKIRAKMFDARKILERIERARAFLRYLDHSADLLTDPEARRVWSDISVALVNNITDVERDAREHKRDPQNSVESA
jgi:energy-coupling factor transporter ATP-binding protein EcfA2